MSELGKTLRTLRLRAGLTQSELAEAANLSLRQCQDIEYGNSNPSMKSLIRLAKALGVSPETIVGTGAMPQDQSGYQDLQTLLSRESVPLPLAIELLRHFHTATPAARIFAFALLSDNEALARAVLKDIGFLDKLKKVR